MLHESVQDEDAEAPVVGTDDPSSVFSIAELTGDICPV